ncbi:MAG TPA: aspartate-semialdehyde dehydrogenase [Tissierellia bacterium]|nr:aspartate-semialdehyde dehydrogenase [Tissierellia bacterium]
MIKLAVVGATGLVGETILEELAKRDYDLDIKLLTSAQSASQAIHFKGRELITEVLGPDSFQAIDYALFAIDGELAKVYVPQAAQAGCVVIDNSSAFRMEQSVPLVVPEVNPAVLKTHQGIIANPNCSTIQSVVPLGALRSYGLKRVIYTTYQSVSGSGRAGIEDLVRGQRGEAPQFYPVAINNNVIPQIDDFLADGYTKEEQKMIEETKKILELPDLKVTATTVRVPLQSAHSVAMVVEMEKPFDLAAVKQLLAEAPGLSLIDWPDYPTPLQAAGREDILVGRIRRDNSAPNSLHIWCVADNIRKGAAGNAVQILDELI